MLTALKRMARSAATLLGAPPPRSERERAFRERYGRELDELRRRPGPFAIIEHPIDQSDAHPVRYIDLECEFASEQIRRAAPASILDIGSYRHWLIGVMAHTPVVTLDVRERRSTLGNETVLVQDACDLRLEPGSVPMVTSLSTIEHLGLGRYGDRFDPEGDGKAVRAIRACIRPGGIFLFTLPITRGAPYIAFNAHRVYTLEMLRRWMEGWEVVAEAFVKHAQPRFCGHDEVTAALGEWDEYCGAFRKPGPERTPGPA